MNNLHFMQNWNKKLDCDIFTTIRIYDSSKHFIGAKFSITWLHGNSILPLEDRECIHINIFNLSSLTNGLALLDTGYNAKDTASIIRTMYKHKNVDVDKVQWVALYLKKIKPKPNNLPSTPAQGVQSA